MIKLLGFWVTRYVSIDDLSMWSPLLLARWWFMNVHVTPEVETSGKFVFVPKKATEKEILLHFLLKLLHPDRTLGIAAAILIPT